MIKAHPEVRPRAVFIICACINVAEEQHISFELYIRAVENGKHMMGSCHYSGDAIDLRSKNFLRLEDKLDFLNRVILRLGKGYEGLLEAQGTANEHFHIEYDPK